MMLCVTLGTRLDDATLGRVIVTRRTRFLRMNLMLERQRSRCVCRASDDVNADIDMLRRQILARVTGFARSRTSVLGVVTRLARCPVRDEKRSMAIAAIVALFTLELPVTSVRKLQGVSGLLHVVARTKSLPCAHGTRLRGVFA
jgi:hypothetical protein